MKKILIGEKKNGWLIRVSGFMKVDGDYVYKSTEVTQMIEFLGQHILDNKIKVEIQ